MEFVVTWPSGQTEIDCSETTTADAYAMERWGCNTATSVLEQYGVTIKRTVPEAPPQQEVIPPQQEVIPPLTEEQLAALQQAEAELPEQPPVE